MKAFRTESIVIERLTVRVDRVVCDVALAPGTPRLTSPALIDRVLKSFPDLYRHACVNGEGDTFAAVMERTSLPHLLEHLVIDLQVRAALEAPIDLAAKRALVESSSDFVFVGTTVWTDEMSGRARIEVSFTDDLVALRAFRDATRFLDDAVLSLEP